MTGSVESGTLIETMSPWMQDADYVFCRVDGEIRDYAALDPVAMVRESEGVTLILPAVVARRESFRFEGTFRRITLRVHSSLQAVGLTAAVSSELASHGIPANIVAGYYHDHLFVPSDKALRALELLRELSASRK